MKVLLINPKITQLSRRRKATSVPLGLLAIASYIKTKGHTVKIVDQTIKSENIEKHIKSFNPDVVGVSVHSTVTGMSAVKVSKTAKKYNKPVIWGGYIASQLTETCFQEGCVDFIVRGEGEITLSELLDKIEHGGSFYDIDGLAFVDRNGIHINKDREFADLASFPVTDWSFINPGIYSQAYLSSQKMIYLYLSKGCPGECTFCYNPKYYKCMQSKRPPEQVVEEIEYLVKNFGIDGVYFADEFFYPGKEDLTTFIRLITEKNLDIKWGGQTRLGVYSKEELQQMYDAGCRWLLCGVESGCEARIKEIKKGINLKKAKETFDNCREIGINTQSSFIIGYPGETEEELKETVSFALSLNASLCPMNIFYYQPGTEIFENVVSSGQYNPPKTLKEWGKSQSDEYYETNLSKIPHKDLMVIHFYTQWLGFTQKESTGSGSYGLAKKMIIETLKNMFRFGLESFLIGTFVSARQFFTVLWYAKAYPKILKKYGLNNKR